MVCTDTGNRARECETLVALLRFSCPDTDCCVHTESEEPLINFNSVTEIKQLLESRGLAIRKRWGQNFLVSPGVREKLAAILDLRESDTVWEIGPGIGSMTSLVAGKVDILTLFEIDPGYVKILQSFFQSCGGIAIREGDFLKTWELCFREQGKPNKIFGNLPYNTGSVMLGRLIEENMKVDKMVFTLQKEVVDRVVAVPGTRDYSSFSMLVQFMYHPVSHGTIAAGAFYPRPNVTSAIVELIPHNRYTELKNRELFFSLAKDLFSSRRKTIRNTIRGGGVASQYGADHVLAAFETIGINTGLRGECLPVDAVVAVAAEIDI